MERVCQVIGKGLPYKIFLSLRSLEDLEILASRYKCDMILLDTALFIDFIPATGTKDKFTFHQYHSVLQILSSTPYVIQKLQMCLL